MTVLAACAGMFERNFLAAARLPLGSEAPP
jgi:hypothetical protein